MQKAVSGLLLVILLAAGGSANAALVSRLSGQAYYDDVLNITWLANANLANTTAFGVAGINANGSMTWDKANEWMGAMNTAAHLGKNDWRLPVIVDTGSSGCNFAYTGTDCGYNVDLGAGEMAHLFYSTLGNAGAYNTSGVPCTGCVAVPGPFDNLQFYPYWSGTGYAPVAIFAWYFGLGAGDQGYNARTNAFYAWAVRDGDIEAPDTDNDGIQDSLDNC
ncbi:MAG: DUF1566 domain-containing protein [Gammaproteobacteria bacterium]